MFNENNKKFDVGTGSLELKARNSNFHAQRGDVVLLLVASLVLPFCWLRC